MPCQKKAGGHSAFVFTSFCPIKVCHLNSSYTLAIYIEIKLYVPMQVKHLQYCTTSLNVQLDSQLELTHNFACFLNSSYIIAWI